MVHRIHFANSVGQVMAARRWKGGRAGPGMLGRFWSGRVLDGISVRGERETKVCYVFEPVGRWT